MSISSDIRQQVAGAIELSTEARNSVEDAADVIDSAVARLTRALSASRDPKAAQALRSLTLARERLTEVAGLFDWVASELPVFLGRLGQTPDVKPRSAPAADTSHARTGAKVSPVSRPESFEKPEPEERTFMAWWGTTSREVADAGTAESVIGEAADRLFADGPRGVAIRLGNGEREQAPLRISIDTAANRAAVFWHGAPGIESSVDPEAPLVVQDDPKSPPVTIPAERARVTPATAIRAAREYVETGRRPTCLNWKPDPVATGSEGAVTPRTEDSAQPASGSP